MARKIVEIFEPVFLIDESEKELLSDYDRFFLGNIREMLGNEINLVNVAKVNVAASDEENSRQWPSCALITDSGFYLTSSRSFEMDCRYHLQTAQANQYRGVVVGVAEFQSRKNSDWTYFKAEYKSFF